MNKGISKQERVFLGWAGALSVGVLLWYGLVRMALLVISWLKG